MTTTYAQRFTWSHLLGDGVIAHTDGAVSVMVSWSGIDTALLAPTELDAKWHQIYRVLETMPPDAWLEFHLWRLPDDARAQSYRAAPLVRAQDFGRFIRSAIADHLSKDALANRAAVVLGLPAPVRRRSLRAMLNAQLSRAERLTREADTLALALPGGAVSDGETYLRWIRQSLALSDTVRAESPAEYRDFPLNEQLVAGDAASSVAPLRVYMVYLYPEATAAWAGPLLALPTRLHVIQVLRPIPRPLAMARAERASRRAAGVLEAEARAGTAEVLADAQGFVTFVERHGLPVYDNVYVIHVAPGPNDPTGVERTLRDYIEGHGGQLRGDVRHAPVFYRIGQPGLGYLSPVFRPDHLWQVAHMIPATVADGGAQHPESLRRTVSDELVGFRLTDKPVAHAFTIAVTGAGKGVEKVATIAETFPLGIDWYLIEIGETYRWLVEAFGGCYVAIDPATNSINPLPPVPGEGELPATQIAATVNALAFLLTDGRTRLTVHEAAVAEAALRSLYTQASRGTPSLAALAEAIGHHEPETEAQRRVVSDLAANLESFLMTADGQVFRDGDTVPLTPGLCGVDLRLVDQVSPRLLKFYLVFLSLRFGHLALANRRPARVLLDELHKFVATAPEVVGRLVSELARMGRKESASIDLVTQGLSEIAALDPEVVSATTIRHLLYRTDQWAAIGDRLEMPPGALSAWKHLAPPVPGQSRAAIRYEEGRYHALALSFPPAVLGLADTRPMALDEKARIGRIEADPIARLMRLAQALEVRP